MVRRRWLLLAATGAAMVVWVARQTGPGSAPDGLEATHEVIGTITEAHQGPGCGVYVWVSEIRYGNAFAVVAPCLDVASAVGPRFAVGDQHRLFVDDSDVVRAIEWNGRRYVLGTDLPLVKAPIDVLGHVSVTTPDLAYDAPGWHWARARLRSVR